MGNSWKASTMLEDRNDSKTFFYYFKHFTPSRAGVPLARIGVQRVKVREKRGVFEEKDGDQDQVIGRCRLTLHANKRKGFPQT